MNILAKSREDLNKAELYHMMTDKIIKKVSELVNKTVVVKDYVIYEDISRTTGEIYKVISIMTDNGCYASNSPTFIECFEQIISCFGSEFSQISIFEGTSNRGRKFIQCSYIA